MTRVTVESKAYKDHRALSVQQVPKVTREIPEQKETKVIKVIRELTDIPPSEELTIGQKVTKPKSSHTLTTLLLGVRGNEC